MQQEFLKNYLKDTLILFTVKEKKKEELFEIGYKEDAIKHSNFRAMD